MDSAEFAGILSDMVKRGDRFVVATVVATSGSSIAKPGFKEIISESGEIVWGTLGGACPESVIIDESLSVLRKGEPKTIRIHLEKTEAAVQALLRKEENEIYVETFCGGQIEVFLEPYLPRERMIIVAQGGRDDIEDSLVALGKKIGMEVVVFDHAPQLREQPDRLISGLSGELEQFQTSDRDYIVVLTKGERDIQTLKDLSGKKFRYIGLLASRKRVQYDFERLRSLGVGEDFLKRIHAPIGENIGAVTPEEIAVSIIAQIIRVRRAPVKEERMEESPKTSGAC
ncbi:hypothetical protein GCM10007108_05970 [Thermogymnomonas acidicola]|uniref:Xanthine dehydrogenase accessory factor n=1 Tax=Thermogymnomonas acidicola TaxID=399579 RepID=A0AA37F9P6_9ARCH|nr:XdhC family protein [Thermogymnomonas acidicola]GGM70729.1 hypothetical protein GCM10007108_05970 [Thermogymnomonas acidicola]